MKKTKIECVRVTEANRRVRESEPKRVNWRMMLWVTRTGKDRKTGWVAYSPDGRCQYWAKTRKEAIGRVRLDTF